MSESDLSLSHFQSNVPGRWKFLCGKFLIGCQLIIIDYSPEASGRAQSCVQALHLCDDLCWSRASTTITRLHLAAWSGQTQVVNYLCKNKADVGAAAMDDMAAIHFAAQKGHLEVVRTLLSFGVSLKTTNRKGMTALHYAIQGSHLELAKYLTKKGASLSAKTKAGKTPLDLARSEEIRSVLIECEKQSDKGDLNGKEKVKEAHPKSPSPEKAEGSDHEVAEVRLEGEAEENKKDESVKRKGDEDDMKENSPKPKKAKVALNHLLTSEDILGEEEIA